MPPVPRLDFPIRLGEDGHDMGMDAVGNPRLRAVDDKIIAIFRGAGTRWLASPYRSSVP